MNQEQTSMKDFTLIKKIGEGSFGKVYKVKRKSDNNIYAIKIVNISLLDQQGKQSALNEIRILCSFQSDFIVGYKEAFSQKNNSELCIVMEYVGGGDLSGKIDHCRKNKLYLDENIVWRYFCQSLIGLKKLHASKIIHRDIKSQNFFLSKDFSILKIGDLNVAKVAKNDLAKTQIGTPYYLAPEIWQNKLYDYRCDIFSLGVVMYELTALKLPFQGNNLQDLQKNVLNGFFKRIPSKFSDDLYSLIKSMLNTNPRLRPTTDDLLQNPLIKNKLSELGYLNLDINEKQYETLINTIIVPKNINQLQKQLPKEKRYEIKSCTDFENNNSQEEFKQPSLKEIQTQIPLQQKFDFNKKNKIPKKNQDNISQKQKVQKMKYEEYLEEMKKRKQQKKPGSQNKRISINKPSRNPIF